MCHYCINVVREFLEHQKKFHEKECNTIVLTQDDDVKTMIKFELQKDTSVDKIIYN